MVKVVITVGPRVVIDTAGQSRKQGSAVVGRRVVNYLTTMFGIYRNSLKPSGKPSASFEKACPRFRPGSGISQSPIPQKGKIKSAMQ
jgi:hypothetical protein